MADVARVILHNIVSFTQGTNTYKGIRSVSIAADKGRLMAILGEGDLYPTGAENVGIPGFPVTTSAVIDSGTIALGLLAEAAGNLVIVTKSAQGGGNKTFTISNHQFSSTNQTQPLQDAGPVTVQGAAFSTDGATLPLAVV